MAQNLIEKIAQRFAVGLPDGRKVRSGEIISVRPAYVMTHDNSGAVIPKFQSIGATSVADPRQIVFTLDHNVQDKSESNLRKYASIEAFAAEHDIDFYPAGRGIGHQVMCEEGYIWPGTMVVASDSHSNMYGGLGCLGTPVVRTDAASIWATGRTWWQAPPVARVELTGDLREGVTGKDVIITLCGYFSSDEVLNHAIEFVGDGVSNLSIDDRLAIANMTTEWGALAGVFPCDDRTIDWLAGRVGVLPRLDSTSAASRASWLERAHERLSATRLAALADGAVRADENAHYARQLTLDLSTVSPHVAGPHNVKTFTSVAEIRKQRIRIDKAYLVSCVNSRVEDLAAAARVVRGHKVAEGVEFYIAAASSEVQAQAERRGDWQTLIDSGADPLPPGCGPCIGLGKGLLEDGEVGISSTNRNFRGRMGSREAEAYLGSPEVVAASAIAGHIELPGWENPPQIKASSVLNESKGDGQTSVNILPGFPETVAGEIVFCHQDNLNTDSIYPGKYTYKDDFTSQQQAKVVMENYDPNFTDFVSDNAILVGGFAFGSGSSREQAATALKYRGIRMVVAGSFSETYKRNAFNNGFVALESPRLAQYLKTKFGSSEPTVKTGITARVDFRSATIEADGEIYELAPVGEAAQELVIADGLENWVRRQLKS